MAGICFQMKSVKEKKEKKQHPLQIENIVKDVFKLLPFEDICRLAPVCKVWSRVTLDPEFWETIDLAGRNVTGEQLCRVLQRHGNYVKTVCARGTLLTTNDLAAVLPHLTSLEHLELERSSIENHSFTAADMNLIAENLPSLRHLTLAGGGIQGAPVIAPPAADILPPDIVDVLNVHLGQLQGPAVFEPDHPMGLLLPPQGQGVGGFPDFVPNLENGGPQNARNPPPARLTHPTLQSLHLEDATADHILLDCPRLTRLKAVRFGTSNFNLGTACNSIEEIHIEGRAGPGESRGRDIRSLLLRVGPQGVVQPLPRLRSLTFSATIQLNDTALQRIGTVHRSIQHLKISRGNLTGSCFTSHNGVAVWPSLQTLELRFMDSLNGDLLSSGIRSMLNLQQLDLSGCISLSTLNVENRKLRHITLVSARVLRSLSIDCAALETLKIQSSEPGTHAAPELRDLRLTVSGTISQSGFSKLTLAACPKLESVRLNCPQLTDVELSDCHQGSIKSIVEQMGPGGGAYGISSLSVAYMDVGKITLASGVLRRFHVISCPRLNELDINCALLCDIVLEECPSLQNLKAVSHAMRKLALGSCSALQKICIHSNSLKWLDLDGCNALNDIKLQCPQLNVIKALLCSSLLDDNLQIFSHSPQLEELHIGTSLHITSEGLGALSVLKHLKHLDLSFLGVGDFNTIVPALGNLSSLSLTNNYAIEREANASILRETMRNASKLQILDASYSRAAMDLDVLADMVVCGNKGRTLQTLIVNGVDGRDQSPLWPRLRDLIQPYDGIESSQLKALSLADSKNLGDIYLGMHPGENCPLKSLGGLEKLEKLNLERGDFTAVGIALPNLKWLNLKNCTSLELLELDCPRLERLSLVSCRGLSIDKIIVAIRNTCTSLNRLYLNSCPGVEEAGAVSAIRAACPSLEEVNFSDPSPMFWSVD